MMWSDQQQSQHLPNTTPTTTQNLPNSICHAFRHSLNSSPSSSTPPSTWPSPPRATGCTTVTGTTQPGGRKCNAVRVDGGDGDMEVRLVNTWSTARACCCRVACNAWVLGGWVGVRGGRTGVVCMWQCVHVCVGTYRQVHTCVVNSVLYSTCTFAHT